MVNFGVRHHTVLETDLAAGVEFGPELRGATVYYEQRAFELGPGEHMNLSMRAVNVRPL